MEWPRTSVIVRWTVAGLVAAGGTWMLILGMTHETGMGGVFLKSIGGFALLIVACLCIGPEIVHWVLWPINYVLDAILLPSETLRPPVDYTLARYYVRQERYEEACEEYFKMIEYHPREVDAYLEGIAAATAANLPATARKFYRKGLRRLSARNGERDRFIQGVTRAPVEPIEEAPETESAEEQPTSEGSP